MLAAGTLAVGAVASLRLNRRQTEEERRNAAIDALFSREEPSEDSPLLCVWSEWSPTDDLPAAREETEREAVDAVFEREDWRLSSVDDARGGTAVACAPVSVGCVKRTMNAFDIESAPRPRRRADSAAETAQRHRTAPFVLAASVVLSAFFGWLAVLSSQSAEPETEARRSAALAAAAFDLSDEEPADLAYETVAIETLHRGDIVMAMDPATGELAPKRVVDVFERTVYELRILHFTDASGNEQELQTTDEHPFWSTAANDFVSAADLSTGDCVLGADGLPVTLASTHVEAHPEGVAVYNFEVEDYHTYFVAAEDGGTPVLVHNKCVTWDSKVQRFRDRSTGRFAKPEPFGTAAYGNYAHDRLLGANLKKAFPNTKFLLRIKPGQTGVDVSYVSGARVGFRHAELKPYTPFGFNGFLNQSARWNLRKVKLLFYDAAGQIIDPGIVLQ